MTITHEIQIDAKSKVTVRELDGGRKTLRIDRGESSLIIALPSSARDALKAVL